MKPFHLLLASISICVSLSGCKKEINEPDPTAPPIAGGGSTHFGSSIQLNVAGQVFDETGGPLEGVVITAGFGNQTTTTDANGAFILQGITGHDRLGYITANKPGYFTGSRSFVPVDGTNAVRISLLAKNLAGTIQGNTGGSVSAEGVQITFSPGSFDRNGAAYNGPVSVALNHIDPSSEELFQQMPGALIGTMDNSAQMLRSFGMVGVELTDGAGTEVEIVSGSTAEVRFPVPSNMMSEAPSSIDLWSFNEDLGHWVHEGQAQLVGSEYVANVGHFSWWNCDIPFPHTYMDCHVSDLVSGSPIGGAQIIISSITLGSASTYTDQQGRFGGVIPLDETMDLQIRILCPDGSLNNIYTQSIGPYTSPADLQFQVTAPSLSIITGSILNCDAEPVSSGYLIANDQVFFCEEGQFNFMMCTGDLEIIPVDIGNSFIGSAQVVQVMQGANLLDPISACGESIFSGTVTDIDGNIYPTVLIGTQEWMAENLRSATYANGDAIPQVMNGVEWGELMTGAWTTSPASFYEEDYGKHYNWYAVTDPRNVCPSGWHVPSDSEWKDLELTLGMPQSEVHLTHTRGEAENVGGKLKGFEFWSSPNAGATNESGFNALPGGLVWGGSPSGYYYWARFWTSSESSADNAWIRNLDKSNGGSYRHGETSLTDKKQGHSVRCVRN